MPEQSAREQNRLTPTHRKQRKYLLRTRYKLTLDDYDALFAEQEGKCGLCKRESCPTGRRFAVDHDHETGVVRGLLCYRCNAFLGWLDDDAISLTDVGLWQQRGRS